MSTIPKITPNNHLLKIGELASDYIEPASTKLINVIKIVSYIFSLLIFPFVAFKVRDYYLSVQTKYIDFLTNYAAESLEGAEWVIQHIKDYRLREYEQRKKVLIATRETITKNYPLFLEHVGETSPVAWLDEFIPKSLGADIASVRSRYFYEEIFTMARKIDKDKGLGDGEFSLMLKRLNDFPLLARHRKELLTQLASCGIMADGTQVTTEEGLLACKNGFRWRRPSESLLKKCMNVYKFNVEQRMEVFEELCHSEVRELAVPGYNDMRKFSDLQKNPIDIFPMLKNDHVYGLTDVQKKQIPQIIARKFIQKGKDMHRSEYKEMYLKLYLNRTVEFLVSKFNLTIPEAQQLFKGDFGAEVTS